MSVRKAAIADLMKALKEGDEGAVLEAFESVVLEVTDGDDSDDEEPDAKASLLGIVAGSKK